MKYLRSFSLKRLTDCPCSGWAQMRAATRTFVSRSVGGDRRGGGNLWLGAGFCRYFPSVSTAVRSARPSLSQRNRGVGKPHQRSVGLLDLGPFKIPVTGVECGLGAGNLHQWLHLQRSRIGLGATPVSTLGQCPTVRHSRISPVPAANSIRFCTTGPVAPNYP